MGVLERDISILTEEEGTRVGGSRSMAPLTRAYAYSLKKLGRESMQESADRVNAAPGICRDPNAVEADRPSQRATVLHLGCPFAENRFSITAVRAERRLRPRNCSFSGRVGLPVVRGEVLWLASLKPVGGSSRI